LRGAGRAEHGDLANGPVRREHLVGVAKLLERGGGDLEIARQRPVLVQLQHGREHLLDVATALGRDAGDLDELGDQSVGGVVLELIAS
jgi:hypothetical protein